MVAVGADGRVGIAVLGAAGVVVDHRLVVEIDHIQRAIRAHAGFDGPEPEIAAAHELRFLAAFLFLRRVGDSVLFQEIVADDVDRRLAGEIGVVPLLRPSAAFVDRATRRRRVGADPVDLLVGRLFPIHQRKGFLAADHPVEAVRSRHLALREDAFRQDGVEKQGAAGRLRPETLAVRRHAQAPGVAALAGNHLDLRAVRLETHHARADADFRFIRRSQRRDLARAVAMGRVNPAIETPAQVIDHRVGVAVAEAGVELGALVRDLVAIGVLQKPNVRRGGGDHAVLMKHETGGQLQLVGKDMFLVHAPVAIRICQDADPVEGIALILTGLHRTAFLPDLRVRLAQAVRILGALHHPHPAFRVPIDIQRLVDQRLGGHQRELKLRMHLDLRRRVLRFRRAADRITQRVHEFRIRAEQRIGLAFPRPRDAAQQQGLDRGMGKIHILVTGNADESAAVSRFIGPHLRLDVIHADRRTGLRLALLRLRRVGGGEDLRLRHHLHVVVDLVVEIEVGDARRDRVLAVGEI